MASIVDVVPPCLDSEGLLRTVFSGYLSCQYWMWASYAAESVFPCEHGRLDTLRNEQLLRAAFNK